MLLSDVCVSDVCVCRVHRALKSRTERPGKTKIGTEIAHVTRDSDTTFKVKVTRPLYSAQPQCVRRLQRSAWERIRHGKVLLRCVCSAAHEALGRPRGRRGAGAYCVATRTACSLLKCCYNIADRQLLILNTFLSSLCMIAPLNQKPGDTTKHSQNLLHKLSRILLATYEQGSILFVASTLDL